MLRDRGRLTMNTYYTSQVSELLNISVATVRNYAKKLEKYGHSFNFKQHARIWTDTEINMIHEIQDMTSKTDYTLEQCFKFIVTKHTEGLEVAEQGLTDVTGTYGVISANRNAEITNISAKIDILLERSTQNAELVEYEQREQDIRQELEELKQERQQALEELESLKNMGYFQFRKWKNKG